LFNYGDAVMNLYIEVGKVTKKDKDKPFFVFISNGETSASAFNREIKSEKQRVQIAQALLDLTYLVQTDTEETISYDQ